VSGAAPRALGLALALGMVALAAPARADLTQLSGCATDNLDARMALQRLDWARKCGLLTNSSGAGSYFPSTRAFDAAGFPSVIVGAKEYREVSSSRSFSGNSNSYDINFSSAFYRYDGPSLFTVTQETSGPTTGYYKWTGSSPRALPYYPTFDSVVSGGGVALHPLPSVYDDCNLYQWDPVTGALTRWTGNHYVIAYCPSGSSALAQPKDAISYENRVLLFRAVPEAVLPQ
jgi:hypothetical protein